MKIPAVTAIALFCEDIREEVGGTFTIVGIYPDNVNLTKIPAILPKLCVYIRVNFGPDAAAKSIKTIKAHLSIPDGQSIELGEMDTAKVQEAIAAVKTSGKQSGVILRTYFSGFNVPKAGLLQLQVEVGGETYLAGALNVVEGPG
jgi:hypothetical protein